MDWNNDGKKDLVVGASYDNGRIKIFLNVGTDAAPVFNNYTFLQLAGSDFLPGVRSMPEIVDWNNDGLKDILCGEEAWGRVYLLTNSGTASAPVFNTSSFIQDVGTTLSLGQYMRSAPVVVDWNHDGKKDLIIGDANGNIHYYENSGTDAAPLFNGGVLLQAEGSTICVGNYARLDVADWDGDGMKDLIVGNCDGELWFFRAINPALPHIKLKSSTWSDANSDGNLDPGEAGYLTCVLTNACAGGTALTAVLSTDSPWCTVESGIWNIGSLAAGATTNNTGHAFQVRPATNAPLGQKIVFRLSITANGGYAAEYIIERLVSTPTFALIAYFVNDVTGNTNGCFNPGENAHVVMRLTNTGYCARNVMGVLTSASPYLAVSPASVPFGTIEKNGYGQNSALPFCVSVSTGATAQGVYPLVLLLSCDSCLVTAQCFAVVGSYAVNSSAPFVWADTSGGTVLTGLLSLDYRLLTLPFKFPFYGKVYTNAYVTSNGQIIFEDSSSYCGYYYNNIGIPSTNLPNAMIAPYWDIFNPSGAVVRCKDYGSAPNRYWVVEWKAVPFYFATNTTATFQAALYEDGKMTFRYGSMSGAYAYGSAATIGIEDYMGRFGVQYSYNQANAVTNGKAIDITVAQPVADADGDGMLDAYEIFYFGNTSTGAQADNDGDGFSNWMEMRCGTDPNSAQSCLCLDPLRPGPAGNWILEWPCVPGMGYYLQCCTNLLGGVWTNVVGGGHSITGAVSGVGVYTSAVPSVQGLFYRLKMP